METTPSKVSIWTGRVLRGLCVLFLLFDAVGKIMKEIHVVQTCATLGLPESTLLGVGLTLLLCTIIYAIPRTAYLGAILLTGYLGGAIAIMMRAGQQVYFASALGLLVWLGLYLCDGKNSFFRSFINRQ
jgi:hypothetical protein